MAQFKKDEIKEKIDGAALAVFASRGYRDAKISDIAAQAGVSVGNIYRYYQGKEEIFTAVLPDSFWPAAQELLYAKIGAFGAGKADRQGDAPGFTASNREFIRFMMENRERMIILLSGSQGTKYENVKAEMASFLVRAVRENYPERLAVFGEQHPRTRAQHEGILFQIYEKLVDIYVYALKEAETPAEMERLIKAVNGYHLFGVTGLLQISNPRDRGELE